MSWAASWVLLAGAVWLVPAPRRLTVDAPTRSMPSAPPLSAPSAPSAPRGGRRIPLRALQVTVVLAGVIGCLAVFGTWRGLLAGCVLAPVAGHLVRRLDERAVRAPPDRALALSLDLIAAALRSGQPLASALVLAAPAAGPRSAAQLTQVARLLRLGADPGEAWRGVADDDILASVAQAACRSADSGIRLAWGFEQVADDIRAQVRAAAQARAHRAGVLAMAPLGLCFLPAFVCLGVVPVVVGIAKEAFGALP